MKRKRFDEGYYYIEMAEFLTEYVLPYVSNSLPEFDEEGNYLINELDVDKIKGLSHLDLEELNIPGVQRVDDFDNYYNFNELILVAAPGRNHKGKEIRQYLRPFNVLMAQLEELGYSIDEIMDILIRKNTNYDFKELDSLDEMTDSNGYKIKERIKYDKF